MAYDTAARSKALKWKKDCTCDRHAAPMRNRSLSAKEANARLKEKNLVALEPWHGRTTLPWKVKCLTCGTKGSPTIGSLFTQSGCKTCGYQRLVAERIKKAAVDATALMIDNGFTPLEEYTGSKVPMKCRHTCGATATVKPIAIKQAIKKGWTITQCECQKGTGAKPRISQEAAFEEMRQAGHEPLEPFLSIKSPWRTIHLECGGERHSTLELIRHGGSGCYPCSRKSIVYSTLTGSASGRWSHPHTISPEAAADYVRSRGFEPIDEYSGSQKKWKMKHSCGAVVTPSLTNLKGGSGCKACHSSFNYMEEAIVYLLKHTGHNALKVGVAGAESANRRMRDNVRNGFAIVKTWDITTGQEAEDIEQEVIRHWRQDLNAPPNVEKAHMRGGHTETASMRKVGLANTIDYIDTLAPRRDTI